MEENKTRSSIQICSFPKLSSDLLFKDIATWKANSLWLANRLRTPRALLVDFSKQLSLKGLASHTKDGGDQSLPAYLFKLSALIYSLVASQNRTMGLDLLLSLDDSLNVIEDFLLDATDLAEHGYINIYGKSCALTALSSVECYSEDASKVWNYVKLNAHAVDNKVLTFSSYVYSDDDYLQCGSFKDRLSPLARFTGPCCNALFTKKTDDVKKYCPFFGVTNFENLVLKQSLDLRVSNQAGITFTGNCEVEEDEIIISQLSTCEQNAEMNSLKIILDNGDNEGSVLEKVAKAKVTFTPEVIVITTSVFSGSLFFLFIYLIFKCFGFNSLCDSMKHRTTEQPRDEVETRPLARPQSPSRPAPTAPPAPVNYVPRVAQSTRRPSAAVEEWQRNALSNVDFSKLNPNSYLGRSLLIKLNPNN